ncbi:hypothetical protein FHS92_001898 [Sphingobium subterraneum]|uniref:Uncharacterized protein n=1 Tax=Sphingobium subterraneum TaxID=627688 RepID=A0A841IYY3_9SPHN|nr:hypothetical protein [Sphingobium subterraneum]
MPLLTAGLLVAPGVALSQPAPPPQRIAALVVYGDDPCPKSEGDEIVVCARKPESERYRIPKPLRDKPAPSGGPGWAGQVALMEDAGRAVQPGSCSVNGSYGFTGCTAAMLRQWFAEKRMRQSVGAP